MLAINPANPLNLVGGSKFFTDPARYRFQIGTYTSFDGGCAWTDNGVLPGFAPSETTSDVTMAFGPKNRVYVAVLYTDDARDSGIAVSTSTDGGKTFGQPVRAYDDPTGAVFSDKPWIAVDMSGGPYNGSVYIVWSYDFGGSCGYDNACQQGLGFVRSTDGGATFSPVRQVEGEAPFCTNPATGRAPDSRVPVTERWARSRPSCPMARLPSPSTIWMSRAAAESPRALPSSPRPMAARPGPRPY